MIDALSVPMASPGSHLHVHGVSWRNYTKLLETFADSPGIRLTYVDGELEVMSPLFSHEDDSRFFYSLILAVAEEWDLPFKHGGSVTLRRKARLRGIEPDECFWIQNAAQMQGKRQLDLSKDPPPDLVVEIEETRSILDRVDIYARLGVPEIWRLTKKGLHFWKSDAKRQYCKTPNSMAFPELAAKELMKFVDRFQAGEEMLTILKDFRKHLRKLRPR